MVSTCPSLARDLEPMPLAHGRDSGLGRDWIGVSRSVGGQVRITSSRVFSVGSIELEGLRLLQTLPVTITIHGDCLV